VIECTSPPLLVAFASFGRTGRAQDCVPAAGREGSLAQDHRGSATAPRQGLAPESWAWHAAGGEAHWQSQGKTARVEWHRRAGEGRGRPADPLSPARDPADDPAISDGYDCRGYGGGDRRRAGGGLSRGRPRSQLSPSRLRGTGPTNPRGMCTQDRLPAIITAYLPDLAQWSADFRRRLG
jgi:hypothetical protein